MKLKKNIRLMKMIKLKQYIIESTQTWPNCVKTMSRWFIENVNTFYGDNEDDLNVRDDKILKHGKEPKLYYCDLIQKNIKDDCVGFVIACLQLFGLFNKINADKTVFTTEIIVKDLYENGKIYKELTNNGFEIIKYNKDKLKQFDIYIGNAFWDYNKSENTGEPYNKDNVFKNKFNSKDLSNKDKQLKLKNNTHHCEIYAGNHKAYTWGALHKSLPVSMYDRKYDFIIRYKNI